MLIAAVLGFDVPVELGRDEAREAARDELSKRMYQEAEPSYLERALGWLFEKFGDLLDRAAAASPGGGLSLVALLAIIVLVVLVVRLRIGPMARSAAAGDPLFVGRPKAADDYRAAADAHAGAGRWAEAVRDRLRAIIRSLEERDLLDPRPGRTADEAAREAGAVLPQCADALLQGARDFDDIWYGGRTARPDHDARLRDLDRRVSSSRASAVAPRR